MIETRSCERFKLLSENIRDAELAIFYRQLIESEAGHYTTFITYARKHGVGNDVEKRWREWIAFEDSVIARASENQKPFMDNSLHSEYVTLVWLNILHLVSVYGVL